MPDRVTRPDRTIRLRRSGAAAGAAAVLAFAGIGQPAYAAGAAGDAVSPPATPAATQADEGLPTHAAQAATLSGGSREADGGAERTIGFALIGLSLLLAPAAVLVRSRNRHDPPPQATRRAGDEGAPALKAA